MRALPRGKREFRTNTSPFGARNPGPCRGPCQICTGSPGDIHPWRLLHPVVGCGRDSSLGCRHLHRSGVEHGRSSRIFLIVAGPLLGSVARNGALWRWKKYSNPFTFNPLDNYNACAIYCWYNERSGIRQTGPTIRSQQRTRLLLRPGPGQGQSRYGVRG